MQVFWKGHASDLGADDIDEDVEDAELEPEDESTTDQKAKRANGRTNTSIDWLRNMYQKQQQEEVEGRKEGTNRSMN